VAPHMTQEQKQMAHRLRAKGFTLRRLPRVLAAVLTGCGAPFGTNRSTMGAQIPGLRDLIA
jgi:hypothetical protein